MTEWLTVAAVADRIGRDLYTVLYWQRQGLLPACEAHVGVPMWTAETIDVWWAVQDEAALGEPGPRKFHTHEGNPFWEIHVG